jgi:16S rRNA G966 N2-methylase RsmD
VFIDASPAAAAIVRENVRLAGVEDRARVLRGDSLTAVRGLGTFDLIFLDPPYSRGLLERGLSAINEFDILRENGIIISELPAEDPVPDAPGGFRRGREYRYGKIRLAVYIREERQ